jgi:hypothetical protein
VKICTQTNTHTFCGVSDENRDLLDTLSSIIISMMKKSCSMEIYSKNSGLRSN